MLILPLSVEELLSSRSIRVLTCPGAHASQVAFQALFVLPSLYEPFGIVFAEAMSYKLPCIGTNTYAMPEIIDEGKSGYLVPIDDSTMLANRIISILKSPDTAKEMGNNGYIKYLQNYTWDAVVQKMHDAINIKYNLGSSALSELRHKKE